MNDDFSSIMTPFDQAVSNQTLQLTKLLIPFLPAKNQRMLAIYVKFLEFQNTFTYFHALTGKNVNDILSYLPPSYAESVESMQNMMNMMQMFQEEDLFQMYQTMFTEQKEGDS